MNFKHSPKKEDICTDFSISSLPQTSDPEHFGNEDTAEDVYKSLNHFLKTDSNNYRLILYLPFSLFPPLVEGDNTGNIQTKEKRKFYSTVRDAWIKLLGESDVRASFTDGDVLEPGMGEPKRVRKAAHLIPFFMQAGVISKADIDQVYQSAILENDTELLDSLDDGLAALSYKVEIGLKTDPEPIETVLSDLKRQLNTISTTFSSDSEYSKKVSTKRIIWERKAQKDSAIEKASRNLSELVNTGLLTLDQLDTLELGDEVKKSLEIKTLLFSIEHSQIGLRKTDLDLIKKITEISSEWWKASSDELKDEITVALSRLKRLNLLDQETATKFSLRIPDLSSPLPIDGKTLIEESYKPITDAIDLIRTDPQLNKYIYPFFICLGSQVKGIAGLNSDIDAALFWRPKMTIEERQKVLGMLYDKCPELKKIDSMPEIWLDEINGKICLKKGVGSSPNSVSPQQIHFIFGGLWVGDKDEIKQVVPDLIDSYLDLNRFNETKASARQHLLRRLEMDALMYRLMHKGFRRSYPERNAREMMPEIDYDSDFYEPEYRQIASLLFISRVFLPDLDLSIKKAVA